MVFLFLALLPEWIWSDRTPSPPTLPRSLPSPLPELIISAAFWSLSHHLRVPLYNLACLVCPRRFNTVLFNLLYVLLSQLLRLAAMATLRVRHEMSFPRPNWHDNAFYTVWWLALGWGLAEAATSITQGYQQLALYRNVMVPEERVREILAQSKAQAQWGTGSVAGSINGSREYMPLSPRNEHAPAMGAAGASAGASASAGEAGSANGSSRRRKDPISLEEAIRLAVDQDVEQLIHLQEREELEEVYGVPVVVSVLVRVLIACVWERKADWAASFPSDPGDVCFPRAQYIPVFVPCLQRVDSFLFSMGFTLVLAWAYLLSPLSFPPGYEPPAIYSGRPLAVAFPLVVVVHVFLSLLHSPPVLPRIGVHTAAYVGLLVGLGGFFIGLGLWGALS